MKIDLCIESKKSSYKFEGCQEFEITATYAPHNLWLLRINTNINTPDNNLCEFTYKKVLCVMEVQTTIEGIRHHGQIASIATGPDGIKNIILNLGQDNYTYNFSQYENSFIGYGDVYCVDLDELRTHKNYIGLSASECFAKLLFDETIDYELLGLKYYNVKTGAILDAKEANDL